MKLKLMVFQKKYLVGVNGLFQTNNFFLKTLCPLFMDGVQLPQGYSHFEVAVLHPQSSESILKNLLNFAH